MDTGLNNYQQTTRQLVEQVNVVNNVPSHEPAPQGGPGFDPRTGRRHHYAFHISDAEFEAIFGRVKAKGLPYGSGPRNHTDGQIYTRRGGRGFYFQDPNGHLLEVMTVRETGS